MRKIAGQEKERSCFVPKKKMGTGLQRKSCRGKDMGFYVGGE